MLTDVLTASGDRERRRIACCGPEPMMLAIAQSLRDHGLTDEQIKFELFASSQPGRAKKRVASKVQADKGNTAEASVTLDGATGTLYVDGTQETSASGPAGMKN